MASLTPPTAVPLPNIAKIVSMHLNPPTVPKKQSVIMAQSHHIAKVFLFQQVSAYHCNKHKSRTRNKSFYTEAQCSHWIKKCIRHLIS